MLWYCLALHCGLNTLGWFKFKYKLHWLHNFSLAQASSDVKIKTGMQGWENGQREWIYHVPGEVQAVAAATE